MLLHLQFMEQLLKAGENIEFFIEGSRSRSGKLALPPKAGLLSVLVDSVRDGRWLRFMPFSSQYNIDVLFSVLSR